VQLSHAAFVTADADDTNANPTLLGSNPAHEATTQHDCPGCAAPIPNRTAAGPSSLYPQFPKGFPNCRSQTVSPQHPASRSRWQRRDRAAEIMAQTRIGVTLKERGRYFEFSAVEKNLPAYKAGARKGDVLMYVEVSTFPDCASRRQHALAPAQPVLFKSTRLARCLLRALASWSWHPAAIM